MPTGPLRLDPLPADVLEFATVGQWTVTRDDVVLGDEDGIAFIPADRVDELFTLAESIRDTERRQSELIGAGTTLREQVRFDAYLAARAERPTLTFRQHLRGVGGAIEE
jgi:hypothetical protein